MKAHTCYHCKLWVEEGEPHNCWTTTEDALTRDLPEDLRDAWERLRELLGDHGEQRIYASHNSIMFSRTACYAFVRPRATRLEVYFFLGRTVTAPQIKKAGASSRVKVAHRVDVRHRDEVEVPLTDWLREAYEVTDELGAKGRSAKARGQKTATKSRTRPTAPRSATTRSGTVVKATPTSKAARKTSGAARAKARR